jgi:hypothetical protein
VQCNWRVRKCGEACRRRWDSAGKLQPLNDRPVVLEARIRFVESGEEQEDWIDQRLTELKARRDRVIVEHVDALRTSLGEPRLRALETFVQDWYNSLTVVPPVSLTAPDKQANNRDVVVAVFGLTPQRAVRHQGGIRNRNRWEFPRRKLRQSFEGLPFQVQ